MTMTIVVFVLHMLCAILWTVIAALNKDNKTLRNLDIICAVLWYICAGIDIVKMMM